MFRRSSATRLSNRNLAYSAFGRAGAWSHNYEWSIRQSNPNRFSVTYPDGRELYFKPPTGGGNLWVSTQPGQTSRLLVDAPNYTLQVAGSSQEVRFLRSSFANGSYFYRVASTQDARGNVTTFTYANPYTKNINKITDHHGRWIKLFHTNMGTATQTSKTLHKTLFAPTDADQWHDVTITPSKKFRFLAFYQGNTWRQKTPMRVSEIEFFDENNNLIIGGTPYGSEPLMDPASVAANAFDGDTSTYYQYAYDKAAYVGLDLGAGNEKKVSRIRYYFTSPVEQDADITFVGQDDPATSNWVVSHIKSSDGRRVDYSYETFTDSSGWFQWVHLTGVNYPGTDQATYTYTQLHDFTHPVIETADDSRYGNPLKRARYAFAENGSIGYVREEYNEATGDKMVTILRGKNGHNPKILWPNGRVKSIFYNKNRMVKSVDSYGYFTDYTYSGNNDGHLLSESDALDRTTTYTRDSQGHILTMTSPSGSVTTYTRDSEGRPLTINRNGDTTTHTRDAQGNITRTDHPDGTYETWTYNAFGKKLTHRARNGHTAQWFYNGKGNLWKQVAADGAQTIFKYFGQNGGPTDPSKSKLSGRLAFVVDAYGNTTSYDEYNDRGQILQMTRTPGNNVAGIQDVTTDFTITTTNTYDDYGNLLTTTVSSSDPATTPQTTTHTYDSLARRLSTTDSLNRTTIWSYDFTGSSCCGGSSSAGASAKPSSITYPDGSVTVFEYDKEWRLLSQTRASGTLLAATTSFTYDGVGQRLTMTDPLGHVTSFTYDSEGRVATTTRAFGTPLAATTTNVYDLDGNLTSTTSAVGTTTTMAYDAMNRAVSTTAAAGTAIAATSSRTYSTTTGELTKVTDPLGRDTSFLYDDLGRNIRTDLPDASFTTTTYDLLGRAYQRTDVLGNTSSTIFTSRGAAKSTTNAAGVTMTYLYDGLGRSTSVTYPSGKTVHSGYDNGNQRTSTTLALGTPEQTVTTTAYDNMGRVISSTDGTGATSSRTYDLLGRTTSSTDGNNLTTSYTYDLDGQLLTVTAPDNIVTSTRTYNALHQLVSNTDGANRTITYVYDAIGRMTSYTDAKNATFSFAYDALSRLITRTEPDATSQSYTYDVLGRLLVHTKADGETKTHHYENPDRDFLTKITYSNGEPAHLFSGHNAAGQPATLSNQHAAITYGYDTAGRPISEGQAISGLAETHTFSYQYNMDGQLQSHTRPDGTLVEYGYNERQLLTSLTADGPPPVADYTYNGRNQLTGTSVENGLFTRNHSYDLGGRLTGVTQLAANGATTLDSTAYTLDNAGQRTGITRNGISETYSYDNARQVITGDYNNLSTTQSWAYDLAGNRSSATTNGSSTNYTANVVNEYSTIGSTSPTYDANGNLLYNGSDATYTWNINNRLISVAKTTGDTGSYKYDPLGRRVARTASIASVTTTTFYLHNGWNVELEHDGTRYTRRRSWGLDLSGSLQGAGGVGGLIMTEVLDASGTATANYYPSYDGNGNITALIDNSGAVVATWRYDAYGNTLATTGTPSLETYRFSTKPYDELTGLYYYGYRYYDPVTGRWPSRDPIGERGGVNLYGMVGNRITNVFDILGLLPPEPVRGELPSGPFEPGLTLLPPPGSIPPMVETYECECTVSGSCCCGEGPRFDIEGAGFAQGDKGVDKAKIRRAAELAAELDAAQQCEGDDCEVTLKAPDCECYEWQRHEGDQSPLAINN